MNSIFYDGSVVSSAILPRYKELGFGSVELARFRVDVVALVSHQHN